MHDDPLPAFPIVVEWPVQWGDQDAFGHVNNTAYLRWFESSRIAYLQRLGLPLGVNREGIGPILAAVHCNYRQQLTFPDRVRIGIRVTRIGRSSLTVAHQIFSDRRTGVVAEGESVIVYYDYRNLQALEIPRSIRDAILQLQPHGLSG